MVLPRVLLATLLHWPHLGTAAALAPALAPALSVPAPEGALDEDQAVTAALQGNPQLRALRKERGVAEGQIVSSTALRNPTLRLDLLHVQAAAGLGFGAGLSWTPPQPVTLLAQRATARAHLDEVGHTIAEREWALAGAVRLCHATLVELLSQQRLTSEALALRRRVVDLMRARVNQGGATRLELNLAELAALRIQREIDDLALRRVRAQGELRGLLGVASTSEVPLRLPASLPSGDEPLPDAAALWAQALTVRPALRAARARVSGAAQVVRAEESRRWPWLQLSGRYRHNGSNTYRDDLQLTMELTVPVLNQNAGPLQVARAARDRDQADLDAQAQALQQALFAVCAELAVQRDILQRLQREQLPVLAEHERLMQAALQGAEVDLVTLLSSEEAVLRGRREHSEVRLQYRRLWLTLQTAVGATLTPRSEETAR